METDENKREPTVSDRAIALAVLRQYWLGHVLRVAEDCWKAKQPLICYPPRPDDIEDAAQLIAEMKPRTELSIAVPVSGTKE